MNPTHTDARGSRQSIRLWPGAAIAIVLVLARYVVPVIAPDTIFYAGLVGMACALAIPAWWLFFSRAPWPDRIGAIVLMAGLVVALRPFVHVSIRTGMMSFMLPVYAIPLMSAALVAGVVASRRRSAGARRVAIATALVVAASVFLFLRTGGIRGGGSELTWRWTATPEERLLAGTGREPFGPAPGAARSLPSASTDAPPGPAPPDSAATTTPAPAPGGGTPAGMPGSSPSESPTPMPPPEAGPAAEWPGFRGPDRDGVVRGVRIAADWAAAPPAEMWRRPIGPGWSSFAVRGDVLYTQEQRGDTEIVAAYRVSTGEPVWRHGDPVRFWESNGGAGPRATPTLDGDRVYAFGATGLLNALDAGSGAVIWSRDVASDTGVEVPMWGFASSPLGVQDVVVVAAAGTLVGYDRTTGDRRWTGPSYDGSYSSPHRVTIGGADQVLLLGGPGVLSVAPASGDQLWEHAWAPGAIVQPALTGDGDILVNAITATGGVGIRRLRVTRTAEGWQVDERWTSRGLKPYFNDFVVHEGHAYGFDGSILACIDLADGSRTWKGGRYGNGQLVLLADQGLLVVISEDGELALVSATPDRFAELGRLPALDGKTWNHPVVVGNVLLVRNGQEMAAYRLSLAAR